MAGIGTAGTIIGLAKFLKERNPEIRVVGVVPKKDYEIDGTVNPKVFKPPLLSENLIDEIYEVERQKAVEAMIRLAREEGILACISSGATVYVASKMASETKRGNIVAILADNIYRYLSSIDTQAEV